MKQNALMPIKAYLHEALADIKLLRLADVIPVNPPLTVTKFKNTSTPHPRIRDSIQPMTAKTLLVRSYATSRAFASLAQSAMQLPKAFILDFDGTITMKDTIGVLGGIGVAWQRERGRDMQGVWDGIVSAYGRDFERHVGEYRPVKEDRKTLSEEIKYLRGLRKIEERSFGRVSNSGLFDGMKREDWKVAGSRAVETGSVSVRSGFKSFVERLRREKSVWGIISVNFSGSFIRGVLEASVGALSKGVEILANECSEDGVLVGPKMKIGAVAVMTTSDAKLASMDELLKSWTDRALDDGLTAVYIGDSGTDIECLVDETVIGIAMSEGGESSLVHTLLRIGIYVQTVQTYEQAGNIHTARDFQEVLESPLFAGK